MTPIAQQIVDLVTENYLKTYKAMSVAEIAGRLELSRPKVRTALNEIYSDTSMLSCSKEERATFSKDYPMFQHGYIRIYVWEPSKRYLAQLLCERMGMEVAK
jgi:hypothetical protein